jgi:hypothetical protein
MSASHGTAARTRVIADNQRTVCDGNCGRCQACEDDFFFQQICDEIEATFKDIPAAGHRRRHRVSAAVDKLQMLPIGLLGTSIIICETGKFGISVVATNEEEGS